MCKLVAEFTVVGIARGVHMEMGRSSLANCRTVGLLPETSAIWRESYFRDWTLILAESDVRCYVEALLGSASGAV